MTQLIDFAEVGRTVGAIVAVMLGLSLLEAWIPLRRRDRWNTAHVGPNLALTLITFATNAAFNTALVAALVWTEARGHGLLRLAGLPPAVAGALVVIALDFTFYVAHVSMHHVPVFWRFHRVHHSDPSVDVTTTIRQHPGEGVIRYAFMAVVAISFGASPAAFATYRVWSVLNGLFEHANVRVPKKLDTVLSLLLTTPNMHKVHHSRVAHETNSNYGNIFSVFDRLLGTFIPSQRGLEVQCGLDGFDDAHEQSVAGLLRMPFGRRARSAGIGRPAQLEA